MKCGGVLFLLVNDCSTAGTLFALWILIFKTIGFDWYRVNIVGRVVKIERYALLQEKFAITLQM